MWRILIADDDFDQRQLVVEMLKGKAEADIVANGKEVIDAYNSSVRKEKPYDLILLDVDMSPMNGIEVLRKIREHEEKNGVLLGEGIPVVMLTGHKEYCVKTFDTGCDDYLVKPVFKDALIKKIETVLKDKAPYKA